MGNSLHVRMIGPSGKTDPRIASYTEQSQSSLKRGGFVVSRKIRFSDFWKFLRLHGL